MKRCVIFDLDGTLVHTLPDIAAAMNRTLEKFGLPVFGESAYKYKVGNGVLKLTERCIGERKDLYRQVLDTYKADYAVNNQVNSQPFKGVAEMLKTLCENGTEVCVLSNKDQADTERVLGHYFPDVHFSVIRGRMEGVPLKPDPTGALLIAEQLGVDPADCWYVGDTSTDMNTGNAAGMETIGVLWGYRPREELTANGARHLVSEPGEIVELVMA